MLDPSPTDDGAGDAGDDIISATTNGIGFGSPPADTEDPDGLGRSFATEVKSLDKTSGGNNDIAGGAGRDLIIGGFGGTRIQAATTLRAQAA